MLQHTMLLVKDILLLLLSRNGLTQVYYFRWGCAPVCITISQNLHMETKKNYGTSFRVEIRTQKLHMQSRSANH